MGKWILMAALVSSPVLAHETCITEKTGYGQVITQCGDTSTIVDARNNTVMTCKGNSCSKYSLESK